MGEVTEELSVNQMLQMFGVTAMTLHNWRKGLFSRTALPTHVRPRGTRHGVYFIKQEVVKWAEENKIEVKNEVAGTPRGRVQLLPENALAT